jgi:hypothetical protein
MVGHDGLTIPGDRDRVARAERATVPTGREGPGRGQGTSAARAKASMALPDGEFVAVYTPAVWPPSGSAAPAGPAIPAKPTNASSEAPASAVVAPAPARRQRVRRVARENVECFMTSLSIDHGMNCSRTRAGRRRAPAITRGSNTTQGSRVPTGQSLPWPWRYTPSADDHPRRDRCVRL